MMLYDARRSLSLSLPLTFALSLARFLLSFRVLFLTSVCLERLNEHNLGHKSERRSAEGCCKRWRSRVFLPISFVSLSLLALFPFPLFAAPLLFLILALSHSPSLYCGDYRSPLCLSPPLSKFFFRLDAHFCPSNTSNAGW